MNDLSVVVPVYNEADSIGPLVEDLGRELPRLVERFEVIVVDDASTDGTSRTLNRLAANRPWLVVRRAQRNGGHGRSVRLGLDQATAEWIFQIDSDGQFVVAEVASLWRRRAESDLVLGVRISRRDPRHRLLLTYGVRVATSLLGGRRLRDVNTPFRLVRRAVWEDVRPLIDSATLAPNIFVSLGAVVRGWRVAEVSVTHLPRETGRVSLRTLRLVRFSGRGLAQLLAFRLRLARAQRSTGRSAGEPA